MHSLCTSSRTGKTTWGATGDETTSETRRRQEYILPHTSLLDPIICIAMKVLIPRLIVALKSSYPKATWLSSWLNVEKKVDYSSSDDNFVRVQILYNSGSIGRIIFIRRRYEAWTGPMQAGIKVRFIIMERYKYLSANMISLFKPPWAYSEAHSKIREVR